MIVYASRTGNVRFIVEQLGLPSVEMTEDLIVNEPYLLMTYTDGLGTTPEIVEKFLVQNYHYCQGVIVKREPNFDIPFFVKLLIILVKYNIPIVRKIELRGFQHDYQAIINYYTKRFRREVS